MKARSLARRSARQTPFASSNRLPLARLCRCEPLEQRRLLSVSTPDSAAKAAAVTAPNAAGVVLTTKQLTSNLFPSVNDDQYHDTSFSLTFVADGSPVRLSMPLQVTNKSATNDQMFFRFTVDGKGLSEHWANVDASVGYNDIDMEDFLTGLTAGSHTVVLQERSAQPMRIDDGPTLSIMQFEAIPKVGPGMTLTTKQLTSNLFSQVNNDQYQNTSLSMTFVADGNPVRLSMPLQVTNISANNDQMIFRFTVDGKGLSEHYGNVDAHGYDDIDMEDFLTGLSPGSHTVVLQERSAQPMRIDDGPTLSAMQFETNPNVGPGMTLTTKQLTSNFFSQVNDDQYHDTTLDMTFVADGNPVRLSMPLQVTNESASNDQIIFRFMVDGKPLSEHFANVDASAGYDDIEMEDYLTGLAPGAHRVVLQERSAQPMRIDDGLSLSVMQFETGAAVTAASSLSPTVGIRGPIDPTQLRAYPNTEHISTGTPDAN
ncbi:MAG TPA: hypothetical protein VG826_18380 [Pirellulales bacterium]|nr:hypothetical protein [Pirellulales bacterium]